jgi:signal transduction histidine kinase
VWTVDRRATRDHPAVAMTEMPPAQHDRYFFDMPTPAWVAVRSLFSGSAAPFRVVRLTDSGLISTDSVDRTPEQLVAAHHSASVMCVAYDAGDEWHARLFVIGSGWRQAHVAGLRRLQRIVRQVGPSFYGMYLVRRVRARAGAMERARVARELHDGVIQAMLGIEMQLEVLRRSAAAGPVSASALEHVRDQVHEEIVSLRELMQDLRPVDVTPGDLPDYLGSLVDRFGRDSGISALFVSELQEVDLPAGVCRELAMIVQEALVNIRKHSGATHVLVKLGHESGLWKLVIDEDGRGFAFEGRLSQAELDAGRRGPLVIKERVRAIGGELTIESSPGRGARLEIAVPQVDLV